MLYGAVQCGALGVASASVMGVCVSGVERRTSLDSPAFAVRGESRGPDDLRVQRAPSEGVGSHSFHFILMPEPAQRAG